MKNIENVNLLVLNDADLIEINGGWDLSGFGEFVGGVAGLGLAIIVNTIEMARDIGIP